MLVPVGQTTFIFCHFSLDLDPSTAMRADPLVMPVLPYLRLFFQVEDVTLRLQPEPQICPFESKAPIVSTCTFTLHIQGTQTMRIQSVTIINFFTLYWMWTSVNLTQLWPSSLLQNSNSEPHFSLFQCLSISLSLPKAQSSSRFKNILLGQLNGK